MIRRGISGVPAFFIGDDVVVGLDKDKILKLVDHRLAVCPFCNQKVRVPINKSNIIIKCPKCKNIIK